jgi:hypothetical protein
VIDAHGLRLRTDVRKAHRFFSRLARGKTAKEAGTALVCVGHNWHKSLITMDFQ